MVATGEFFDLVQQLMTAAPLPMIAVLVSPIAMAMSFCVASVAAVRLSALTLCRRRSHDIAKPQFARFTGVAHPFAGRPTC